MAWVDVTVPTLASAEGLGGDAEFKLADYKRSEGGEQASGMLGGKKEVSVSDKDVKAAAQEVVKHLSAQSNSLEKMQLAEVRPSGPCPTGIFGVGWCTCERLARCRWDSAT